MGLFSIYPASSHHAPQLRSAYVSPGSDVEHVPLHVVVVVLHVDAPRDHQFFIHHGAVADMLQVHLLSIVGPGAELHEALLNVKRKVLHVDGAVTFVDGGWFPHDLAVEIYCGLGFKRHYEGTISTVEEKSNISELPFKYISEVQRLLRVSFFV